jgi:hypothetical protein
MKDYLRTLKISGHHIFSEDTMEYLTSPESKCMAYEFKQENESDEEFLENFSKWLHEYPQIEGHVEYYLLMGLRYKKHLTNLYLQTVCKLAKVYALPLLLAAMGITSIFAGHRILSVRHLKAVADTFAVREAFSEYRGRVADRIGAEEEKLLYLNGEKAIVTDQEIDPNTGEVRPNSHEETVSLGESKMSYTYICSPETMISFPSTISDGTFRKMLEFRIKSANEYLERHDQTVLGDIMRHFWNDEYCRQHSEIFTDGWWIDNPLAPALDTVHPIVADIKRIPDENGGRKYAVTFNCQGNIAEAMRIAKKQERAERRQEKKSGRKIKAMVV